jgi:transcriptional regulator with XRE-family HTH domain
VSQLLPVIENIKKELKSRGIPYAELARRLNTSEATVKRMFAKRDFSLRRLEEIMEVMEIDFATLMRVADPEAKLKSSLTWEQEQEIVDNPKLFLIAVCVLNLWPIEDILERYNLPKSEVVSLLLELDKMGFIQLQANNRVRLLISRTFAWLPNGPMQQSFRKSAALDFLNTDFSRRYEHMTFMNAMLTKKSATKFIEKLQLLAREFSVWHQEEGPIPVAEKVPMSLLLATRPWLPEGFLPYIKQPKQPDAKPAARVYRNK